MPAAAAAAPSGVVTFLFTDVEGSTRRWETDAEAMRAALAAHDEVLHEAIEAHGGFMFKHTGDGVCAAFASPRSAVDAAVAAQRALELSVRMGIATGEAELRGADYFGAVLNRAARVMAAGHGGQVLVADSTAGLLSGVELVDLGPRRLRDVSAPVGVFQVRAPGLRTEFPSLRALDTSPGNLRPAASSFIGRESELDEVQAAVNAHRLVTLTGVGGVGKTRLATEVATQLADDFPDGVWFFELAAVTDPAAVPDAVAAVLGITQQPGKISSPSGASNGPTTSVSCSSPCTIVGQTIQNYAALPGQTIANYAALPGKTATNYAALPGQTIANYAALPGKTATNYAALPGQTIANYAALPGQTITNYALLPLRTLSNLFPGAKQLQSALGGSALQSVRGRH